MLSGLQRLLCVDEVRGKLTFALNVDHSSLSDTIAQHLSHLCRFLRHLRRQQTTQTNMILGSRVYDVRYVQVLQCYHILYFTFVVNKKARKKM